MNPRVKWACLRTGGGQRDALCALEGSNSSDRKTTKKQLAVKSAAYMQPMFENFIYRVVKYRKDMT